MVAAKGFDTLVPARASYVVTRVAIGVLLVILAAEVWVGLTNPLGLLRQMGGDYRLYTGAARTWLAGDGFYRDWQLAGPYEVTLAPGSRGSTAILYPPVALALFVPFSFLPAFLWWAVPLLAIGAMLAYWRPSPWGWTAILACLVYPTSWAIVTNGNPSLWVAAVVALATRWPFLGPFAFLKPTLGWLGLGGLRRREWWLGALAFALLCLAFAPMWLDYLTVARNARGAVLDPMYSLSNVPTIAVGLIAWATRTAAAPAGRR
jgi:hypothetical protein